MAMLSLAGEMLATPFTPLLVARLHARVGIHHRGHAQHRKLLPDQPEGLDGRTGQQQLDGGVAPSQAVHHVVGFVRDITPAVAIAVPAHVVAPVVAALRAPAFVAGTHVADHWSNYVGWD